MNIPYRKAIALTTMAIGGSMPFSVELDIRGTDELVRRPAALPAA